MKRPLLTTLFFSLLIFCVLSSCKKEETSKLYMTGSINFELPAYVLKSSSIESYATGITDPKGIDYYWYSKDILTDTVWSQSVKVTLPDSIGSFSITAGAMFSGYYSSVYTKTVTTIDPDLENGSLKGIKLGDTFIVDPRDGNKYYYVKIGSLEWFSLNLRYAGTEENPVGGAYLNSKDIAKIFGNLYTWNDATGGVSGSGLGLGPQGACPEGWSVPTREDWEDFGKAINNGVEISFDNNWNGLAGFISAEAIFNDEKMWPYCPDFIKTNDFGWNALPCGNSTDGYVHFKHIFEYGMWWSSTEASADEGSYRYIYYNQGYVAPHHISKTDFGASVRCVRLIP